MTRRNVVLLTLLVAILASLALFYLYLTGGDDGTNDADTKIDPASGVVHVRSIYTADGENLSKPTGLGVTNGGDFYITLKDDTRVMGFDRDGDFKVKWGTRGLEQGQLLAPIAVAAADASNEVYVVDRARLRIIAYDTEGRFLWEHATLNPVGIAVRDNDLLVSTYGPILRMSREGEPLSEYGARGLAAGEFDYARSILPIDGDDVLVADTNNTRIQRVAISEDETAPVKWVLGQPPTRQDDPATVFGVPSGLAADDDGNVYVLDGFRHKITVVDPETGRIRHEFEGLDGQGDGKFQLPTGIGYLGGDSFVITDTYNDRVQIIRLLLPERNTVFNRNRWLLLLPALLLFPLAFLFGRRRTFVTREALAAAAAEGRLRLLAGAFRSLHVLPEVSAEYAGHQEAGVDIGQFLSPVGGSGEPDLAESRLAEAARLTLGSRLLLRRHTIVCADADQCRRMAGKGYAARDWVSVREEFAMEGDDD